MKVAAPKPDKTSLELGGLDLDGLDLGLTLVFEKRDDRRTDGRRL